MLEGAEGKEKTYGLKAPQALVIGRQRVLGMTGISGFLFLYAFLAFLQLFSPFFIQSLYKPQTYSPINR
jgi:hypothetical protein